MSNLPLNSPPFTSIRYQYIPAAALLILNCFTSLKLPISLPWALVTIISLAVNTAPLCKQLNMPFEGLGYKTGVAVTSGKAAPLAQASLALKKFSSSPIRLVTVQLLPLQDLDIVLFQIETSGQHLRNLSFAVEALRSAA